MRPLLYLLLLTAFSLSKEAASQSISIEIQSVEMTSVIPGSDPVDFRFTGEIVVTGHEQFMDFNSWIDIAAAPLSNPEDTTYFTILNPQEDPSNPGTLSFEKDIPISFFEGNTEYLIGSRIRWLDFSGEEPELVTEACSELNPVQLMVVTSVTEQSPEESESELSMFPNPTIGPMTITGLKQDVDEQIFVYDMSGREVFQSPTYGREQLQIDLSGLSRGTYLIYLSEDRRARIVKN